MRSNEILSAILATIAYLETSQGAPVTSLVNPLDLTTGTLENFPDIKNFGIGEDAIAKRSVVTTVAEDAAKEGESLLDKAIGSGVSGLASSVGGSIGTEVVDGVKSLASKVGLKREDQPSQHVRGLGDLFAMHDERSIVSTVEKDAAKGVESLWDKAVGAGVSGAAGAVGSGIGSEVVDGVKSLASKVGLKREDQPAYYVGSLSDLFNPPEARSVAATVEKDAAKGAESLLHKAVDSGVSGAAGAVGSGIGSEIVSGAKSLASDVGLKRDGQPATHVEGVRSLLSEAGKALSKGAASSAGEGLFETIASDVGLKRDGQPSTHVRGIGSLLGDAAKALAGGAAKTAGEDVLGSLASDIGLKRDGQPAFHVDGVRSLIGDAMYTGSEQEGTGTQDAPAAQRTLDAAANGGHFQSKTGSSKTFENKQSETVAAAHAARSGDVLSTVEHVAGKVLPWALDAVEDLKRSETLDAPHAARSGIWSEIGKGIEKVAPIALGVVEDLKRSETVDAPLARRSSEVWHDIETVGGTALKVLGGLFEEE